MPNIFDNIISKITGNEDNERKTPSVSGPKFSKKKSPFETLTGRPSITDLLSEKDDNKFVKKKLTSNMDDRVKLGTPDTPFHAGKQELGTILNKSAPWKRISQNTDLARVNPSSSPFFEKKELDKKREKVINRDLQETVGKSKKFSFDNIDSPTTSAFTGQYLSSRLQGLDEEESAKQGATTSAIFDMYNVGLDSVAPEGMKESLKEEAASVLGVERGAKREEIKKAYDNIIKATDRSDRELQANIARDILTDEAFKPGSREMEEIQKIYNEKDTPEGKSRIDRIIKDSPKGINPSGLSFSQLPSDAELNNIERLLKAGVSRNKVAKEAGYNTQLINKVAENLEATGRSPAVTDTQQRITEKYGELGTMKKAPPSLLYRLGRMKEDVMDYVAEGTKRDIESVKGAVEGIADWAVESTVEFSELPEYMTEKKTGETPGELPPLNVVDALFETAQRPSTLVPFYGGAQDVAMFTNLTESAYRVQKGTEDKEDVQMLVDYLNYTKRDRTFGYKVVSVLREMPAFAGELYASFGSATAARKGTEEGAKKLIRKVFQEGGEEFLEKKATKWGIKGTGFLAARTAQAPLAGATKIPANTLRKQVQSQVYLDDEKELVSKEGQDLWNSAVESFGEQWLETVSEYSGGAIEGLSKPIKNKFVKTALFSSFKKANPAGKIDDFAKIIKKMGWNGVLGEMAEEQVANVGNVVLEPLGLSGQEFAIPTPEDLGVQFVAFSIPGVGVASINQFNKKINEINTGKEISETPERVEEEMQAVEERSYEKLESMTDQEIYDNYEEILESKEDEPNNVLNNDLLKELFEDYRLDPANAAGVHNAASLAKKRIESKWYEDHEGTGEGILIMGGGSGAGKSFSIREAGINMNASSINDTTLSRFDSARRKVNTALEATEENVEINYVVRDPLTAFTDGVVPRAKETGRVVPLKAHFDMHFNVPDVAQKLINNFRDNDRVSVNVVSNLGTVEEIEAVEDYEKVEFLENQKLDKNEQQKVREQAKEELKKFFENGEIGLNTYRKLLGKSEIRKDLHREDSEGLEGGSEAKRVLKEQDEGEMGEAPEEVAHDSIPNGLEESPLKMKFEEDGAVFFPNEKIESPADVAFVFNNLQHNAQENLYTVALKNGRPIGVELVSMGNLNSTIADPMEVLPMLIDRGADSFWMVHNHPSGDVNPSTPDLKSLKSFRDAGEDLGLGSEGLVIVNTTHFGFVNSSGFTDVVPYKNFKEGGVKVPKYSKYIEWHGNPMNRPKISNSKDMAEIIQGVTHNWNENILATFMDVRSRILFNETISIEEFNENRLAEIALDGRSTKVILSAGEKNGAEIYHQIQSKDLKENLRRKYNLKILDTIVVKNNGEWRSLDTQSSGTIKEWNMQKMAEGEIILENEDNIPGMENWTARDIKSEVRKYVNEWMIDTDVADFEFEIKEMAVTGSRARGLQREDSDLDVVIEYSGSLREDSVFNVLNEERLELDGVEVDINPIRPGESGTLEDYREASEQYWEEKEIVLEDRAQLGQEEYEREEYEGEAPKERTALVEKVSEYEGPGEFVKSAPKPFHSVKLSDLQSIEDIGNKITAPSFGIAKSTGAIENYGDITFIPTEEMFRESRLYSRDIWSPTLGDLPETLYEYNKNTKAYNILNRYVGFDIDQAIQDALEASDPRDYFARYYLRNEGGLNSTEITKDIAEEYGWDVIDMSEEWTPEEMREIEMEIEAHESNSLNEFIDKQGKVMYHATAKEFDEFSDEFRGSTTEEIEGVFNTGLGTFFADSKENIEEFKNTLEEKGVDTSDFRTIEVVLDSDKFLNFNKYNEISEEQAKDFIDVFGIDRSDYSDVADSDQEIVEVILQDPETMPEVIDTLSEDQIEEFRERGYSGMISDFGYGENEYVVWKAEDITTRKELEDFYKEVQDDGILRIEEEGWSNEDDSMRLEDQLVEDIFPKIEKTPDNITEWMKERYGDKMIGVGSFNKGAQSAAREFGIDNIDFYADTMLSEEQISDEMKENMRERQSEAITEVIDFLDADHFTRDYASELAGEMSKADDVYELRDILYEQLDFDQDTRGRALDKSSEELQEILDKVKDAYGDIPTDYFEAKTFNNYDINDFPAIVTSNREAIVKLRDMGYEGEIVESWEEYYNMLASPQAQTDTNIIFEDYEPERYPTISKREAQKSGRISRSFAEESPAFTNKVQQILDRFRESRGFESEGEGPISTDKERRELRSAVDQAYESLDPLIGDLTLDAFHNSIYNGIVSSAWHRDRQTGIYAYSKLLEKFGSKELADEFERVFSEIPDNYIKNMKAPILYDNPGSMASIISTPLKSQLTINSTQIQTDPDSVVSSIGHEIYGHFSVQWQTDKDANEKYDLLKDLTPEEKYELFKERVNVTDLSASRIVKGYTFNQVQSTYDKVRERIASTPKDRVARGSISQEFAQYLSEKMNSIEFSDFEGDNPERELGLHFLERGANSFWKEAIEEVRNDPSTIIENVKKNNAGQRVTEAQVKQTLDLIEEAVDQSEELKIIDELWARTLNGYFNHPEVIKNRIPERKELLNVLENLKENKNELFPARTRGKIDRSRFLEIDFEEGVDEPSIEDVKEWLESNAPPRQIDRGETTEAQIRKAIEEDIERARSQVITEMELAEAGYRIPLPESQKEGRGVYGVGSTYPEWVPSKLRKRNLFDKTLEYIKKEEMPPKRNTRQRALYQLAQEEMGKRVDSHLLDKKQLLEILKDRPQRATLIRNLRPPSVNKILGKETSPLIRKRESTLLKERVKNYARGVRKGRINIRKEAEEVIKEFQEMLKDAGVKAKDRAKFIPKMRNIATNTDPRAAFEREFGDIERRINKYIDSQIKRDIRSKIKRELKYTKPVKQGDKRVGKYNYEANKFFKRIRKYNNLTQDEALSELLQLEASLIDKEDSSQSIIPESKKIEMRMLQMKANGMDSSVELFNQVLFDIRRMKAAGSRAKSLEEYEDLMKRKEGIEDAMNALEERRKEKENRESAGFIKRKIKEAVDTKLKQPYEKAIANTYSLFNSLLGEEFANKYDPTLATNRRETAKYNKNKELMEEAAEIFEVDEKKLEKKILELINEEYEYTDIEGRSLELNKMQILNMYNAIKNETSLKRRINAYGEQTVYDIIDTITPKEAQFADLLQEKVQEYRDVYNKLNIERTGRDMGNVENYWPESSEHHEDILDDIRIQGETPTAMKKRSQSTKIYPIEKNAYIKAMKHISQGEHVRHLSRKYEELKRIFNELDVKKEITDIYDEDTYDLLNDHIERISLNNYSEKLNVIENIFDKALNNWTVAKIALPSISTPLRQLGSMSNFAVEMPAGEWARVFKEGVKNPKETFDFMWDNNPFLEARFNKGYSRALSDALEGVNELKLHKHKYTNLLTFALRGGDVSAIIYGGYPYFKYEFDKAVEEGYSRELAREKARRKLEETSIKTQQSNVDPALSLPQASRNTGLRFLYRFKNTANQYVRKIADDIIKYSRGSISKKQLGKTIGNYLVLQSIFYKALGRLADLSIISLGVALGMRGWDDEDEDTLAYEIFEHIFTMPFQALPLLDNISSWTFRGLADKYQFDAIQVPIIDDINDAFRKIGKEEFTWEDFIDVLGTPTEITTGSPVKRIYRTFELITGAEDEEGTPSVGASEEGFDFNFEMEEEEESNFDFEF